MSTRARHGVWARRAVMTGHLIAAQAHTAERGVGGPLATHKRACEHLVDIYLTLMETIGIAEWHLNQADEDSGYADYKEEAMERLARSSESDNDDDIESDLDEMDRMMDEADKLSSQSERITRNGVTFLIGEARRIHSYIVRGCLMAKPVPMKPPPRKPTTKRPAARREARG